MATDTQSPWINQAIANGSAYSEAGHKKRRQRGKRRWPPKVGDQTVGDETDLTALNAAQAQAPSLGSEAADGAQDDGSAEEQALIDPDLIRVLHSLSNTIDTAHHVLYAAAEASNRQQETEPETDVPATMEATVEGETRLVMEAGANQHMDTLGRSGGNNPNGFYSSRGGGGLPPFPPIPPEPPAPTSKGLKFATAATALIVVGAIGWTLNANPWLISGAPQSVEANNVNAAQPVERTANANGNNQVADVPKAALSVAVAPPQPSAGDVPTVSQGNETALISPSRIPSNDNAAVVPAAPTRRVTNTVHGPATIPIGLGLEAPARQGDTELSAMIQGVPDAIALSSGQRIAGGTWIVEASEIESLSVTAPANYADHQFTLAVTMVTSDGKIPEEHTLTVAVQQPPAPKPTAATAATGAPAVPASRTQPVVAREANEPVAALAPAQGAKDAPQLQQRAPAKQPLSKEAEARFLRRGEALLSQRDIAAARLMFEHAARQGSKAAMTALAKTYDPGYLAERGIPGSKGDQSQASAWYERAAREADR